MLSIPERIEASIRSLPKENRTQAEADFQKLRSRVDPSWEGLAAVIADSTVDAETRSIAIWVVGLVKERRLVPVLEEVVTTAPPDEVLWEAAKALCALKQGKRVFLRLLGHSSTTTRRVACFALGCLRAGSAVKALCELLASPDEHPAVRGQAAEALGYISSRRSLPCLLKEAQSPVPEVRFWVAFALGNIGDPVAEPVLREMARRDHVHVAGWGQVSEEAAAALTRLFPIE